MMHACEKMHKFCCCQSRGKSLKKGAFPGGNSKFSQAPLCGNEAVALRKKAGPPVMPERKEFLWETRQVVGNRWS